MRRGISGGQKKRVTTGKRNVAKKCCKSLQILVLMNAFLVSISVFCFPSRFVLNGVWFVNAYNLVWTLVGVQAR